ncbi:Cell division cycle and apoptosis regulator protein, partial [Thalictrum thalictroides]
AKNEDKVTGAETEPEKEIDKKDETKSVDETEGKSKVEEVKDKAAEVETKDKAKTATKELTVDKELLQAFRFFDRNRVGYIKVEDMRFILHNLGKFLSHRDVKELVQSALLESNTARDNRILYNKLVRS